MQDPFHLNPWPAILFMLARTSFTPLETTNRGGRRACIGGGSGSLGVLSACVFAHVSPTATREAQCGRKLTLRHVQIVDCFGWCKKMRLLSVLSSFAFFALLLYARQSLPDVGKLCQVSFSYFATPSLLIIARSTAMAKVSLLIVVLNELPTWPPTAMKKSHSPF